MDDRGRFAALCSASRVVIWIEAQFCVPYHELNNIVPGGYLPGVPRHSYAVRSLSGDVKKAGAPLGSRRLPGRKKTPRSSFFLGKEVARIGNGDGPGP